MWSDYVAATLLELPSRARRLRYQKSSFSFVHRLADAVSIVAGLWLACLATGALWSPAFTAAGAIGLMLFFVLAETKSLYRSWRGESVMRELGYALEVWLAVVGLSLVAVYVQQDTVGYPPKTILYWFLASALMLAIWRLIFRYAMRRARASGFNTRRLAIAGSGDLARHVARMVQENPWMGFEIVGLFDDADDLPPGTRGLRSLDTMVDLARNGGLDAVYVALPPGLAERQVDELVSRLGDSTVSVYLVQDRRSREIDGEQGSYQILPDLQRIDVLQSKWVNLGGIKAVSVYESPFFGPDGWVKRLEDIAVSSLALFLLALPMAVIAVGVRLSGPGPVLFKQRRYGLDGRQIMVWKFRSMTVCEDGDNITQASRGDARVTRLGALLRRTSLDELPQFINVFQGSMSVVGPRPHAVAHNEYYRGRIGGYMLRHKVKPGITGWAQINGWRGETDSIDKMGRRVDFDLEYIRNWSLWFDIRIILMTALRGFVQKTAY